MLPLVSQLRLPRDKLEKLYEQVLAFCKTCSRLGQDLGFWLRGRPDMSLMLGA